MNNLDEIILTVRKEVRHYMRLSVERELYTLSQACFRLNCSRKKFYQLYVDTGKIFPLIIAGSVFISNQDIKNCIENEQRYISRKYLDKNKS